MIVFGKERKYLSVSVSVKTRNAQGGIPFAQKTRRNKEMPKGASLSAQKARRHKESK